MAITVFGSINIDLTAYMARLPLPGETLHGDRYAITLGGKGCNQAVAASRLGTPTTLVGRIGLDNFGDTALAALQEFNVPTNGVRRIDGEDTGVAVIGVDAKGENCITVIGGANMTIDHSDVDAAKDAFANSKVLMLQMEIPLEAALSAADMTRANGGLVILDPAPAPANGYAADVYKRVDVITPNESETEILTGLRPTNAEEAAIAATKLREHGISIAIVKLGRHGVYFQSDNDAGFVEPFSVNSIDSVAAGDCFNGGLAHGLANGLPIRDAVRFAAACGALSTTKTGAAESAPTLAEVKALLNA